MRALVLSGGGAFGAFEVGVLDVWLREEKREYDILCGVSVGALNAAWLSQAPRGGLDDQHASLQELWLQLNTKDVRRSWPVVGELAALWRQSVYDSAPLQRLVRSSLRVDAIRASGRKVRVGAVSWETGEYVTATEQDPHFAEWVLASSSYPVFLSPIRIGARLWSDGGLRNVTPLGDAIRAGADEVDVIMCSPESVPQWVPSAGALPFAMRALDLLMSEVIENDLKVAALKNQLGAVGHPYKSLRITIVRPRSPLPGSSLSFDPATSRQLLALGREAAKP